MVQDTSAVLRAKCAALRDRVDILEESAAAQTPSTLRTAILLTRKGLNFLRRRAFSGPTTEA
jgi:hypothetical protein